MEEPDKIKYLEGNRIYLRRVEAKDVNHYIKAVSDPEIRFLTGTSTFLTKARFSNIIESWSLDPNRIDLIICLQEDDKVIGDLAIVDIDQKDRKGSFRIAITDENYLSNGYGTEALKLIINYMFETLNLRRIAINVYSYNKRAIKAYQKLGFMIEGTLREDLYFNGNYHDNILMGLLKRDYIESI